MRIPTAYLALQRTILKGPSQLFALVIRRHHPHSFPNLVASVRPERTSGNKKRPAQDLSRPFGSGGLLRRRCGSDWLQHNRADCGPDHFAGDDEFNSAILLAAFGSVVRCDGPGLSKALGGG